MTTAVPTTAQFHGCRFSYTVDGDGPPVVFIQGVGVAGSGWAPQVEGLRASYQCLTFDNRGMGASQPAGVPVTVEQMAQDTLWLMDQAGWASAHLVGHSLGGPVAMEVALTARQRVRSLALLCTVARGADATRLSARMFWLGLRSNIGTRRSRRRAFLEIVMPPDLLRDADRDALAAQLEPLFGHDLAVQPPIAMKQLGALRKWDGRSRLRALEGIPTLVASAAHDPIAPPVFGRALADGIPGTQYVEFADASHGLPIQRPAEVNDRLGEHFAAVERGRVATGRSATGV